MRITRIEIQGPKGQATLRLDYDTGAPKVRVNGWAGALTREPFDDWARCNNADEIAAMARRLQTRLDGHAGTAGDVAAYRTLLEQMA
jgi:hypothetical protein